MRSCHVASYSRIQHIGDKVMKIEAHSFVEDIIKDARKALNAGTVAALHDKQLRAFITNPQEIAAQPHHGATWILICFL